MLRKTLLVLLAINLPTFSFALAKPNPASSAGVVEREIEREYEARMISPFREIPFIELDLPEEQLNLPDGQVTVSIESINFIGNTVFSDQQLKQIVQNYTGKCLCMADIREVCLAVQEAYVKNGYFLARAFPPPQRIDAGVLTIQVVEGCLGDITIEGNHYYPSDFIYRYFSGMRDCPINYDQLLRALLLLNENSDMNARAIFVKGKELGCADLVIYAEDACPSHLLFNGNNFGTNDTTRWRVGGRLDYRNLFAGGDTLSIAGVCGFPYENLKFLDVIYDCPLTFNGDYISIGYIHSDSRVSEFRELRLGGKTDIATVELRHAIQRNTNYSTNAFLVFEAKQVFNYALGQTTTYDKLRIASAGLDYDGTDRFGGRNIADASVSVGIPDFLEGSKAVDKHASRTGSGGRFVMFNLDWTRLQPLPGNQLCLLNFSGQAASTLLPLPQQFYIGGPNTVRGYAMAAALGDDGYFLNLEYRFPPPLFAECCLPCSSHRLGDFVQMVTFIDNGGVYLKKGKEEGQNNYVSLTGAGIGLRVHGPWGLEIDCDVGVPLTRQEKTASVFAYLRLTWAAF